MPSFKFLSLYLLVSFCLFSSLLSFSQARINIVNGAYVSMGGGSGSSPVYLVVENGNANAITRTGSGHIVSENEYNKLKWNIGTNTGVYQFPIGKGTSDYMPFYLNKTTSGTCPLSPCTYAVSTYYSLNNSVLPSGATNVNPGENSAIDRFWVINLSGYTGNPTSDVRFYYIDNPTELDGIPEAQLKAQRWSAGDWQLPVGTVNTTSNYVEVVGVSQFSPWALVDNLIPLPIKLLDFTAEWKNTNHTSALLSWTTATETNNDYFNIERSEDGTTFTTIGTIKGAGNSSSVLKYEFTDADLQGSVNIFYYRLKQVDYNGQFSYSKVVTLSRNNSLSQVSVFPNPTTDLFNISIVSPEEINTDITLLNMLSQEVWSKQVSVVKGKNEFSFNVSSLAKGVYTVKVTQNNKSSIQKLILQ